MGSFSNSQVADAADCGCDQGNLFIADFPLGRGPSVPLNFSVNGAPTGPIPTGEVFKFPNTLQGTTSTLAVTVGDREIELIENLGDFNVVRPEDVGVYVGPLPINGTGSSAHQGPDRVERAKELLRTYGLAAPTTRGDQIQNLQNQISADNADLDTEEALNNLVRSIEDEAIEAGFLDPVGGDEDLVILAIPPSMEGQISEQTCNIESAPGSVLRQVAISVACGMGVVDEITGAAALRDITSGAVDFTVGGTGTLPLIIELQVELKRADFKSFLRKVVKLTSAGRVVKVFRNAQGILVAAFPAHTTVRDILKATSAKVAIMGGAVKGTSMWRSASRAVSRGIPVLSYLIVGVIDVVEWLALPDEERTFAELAGQLIPDMAKISISSIVGTIALGLATYFGAPLWLAIGAGIGIGVLVGIALDSGDAQFGITDAIKGRIPSFGTLETHIQRVQTFPSRQVSSARLPGQIGSVQAGHETNALDVISDTPNVTG